MASIPDTRASLLVRLPNAADVEAWQQFISVYGPSVYRLARRKGLQPADAEDLVQEALAAIARSIEGWLANPERGSFRAWLFRIAQNLAINYLTRRKYRATGTGDSRVARMLHQQADPVDDLSSEFAWEYRREVFRWAADQIRPTVAPRNWQAFWLTTVESRPLDEVAKELHMSIGNLYIARSRIMTRLRELVRQFEEHDG